MLKFLTENLLNLTKLFADMAPPTPKIDHDIYAFLSNNSVKCLFLLSKVSIEAKRDEVMAYLRFAVTKYNKQAILLDDPKKATLIDFSAGHSYPINKALDNDNIFPVFYVGLRQRQKDYNSRINALLTDRAILMRPCKIVLVVSYSRFSEKLGIVQKHLNNSKIISLAT